MDGICFVQAAAPIPPGSSLFQRIGSQQDYNSLEIKEHQNPHPFNSYLYRKFDNMLILHLSFGMSNTFNIRESKR